MTVCPYCNIEVSESAIEAEDGCCPECGAQISATSSFFDEEHDSEYDEDMEGADRDDVFDDDDDEFEDDYARDAFDDGIFDDEDLGEGFDDDDFAEDEEFEDEEDPEAKPRSRRSRKSDDDF